MTLQLSRLLNAHRGFWGVVRKIQKNWQKVDLPTQGFIQVLFSPQKEDLSEKERWQHLADLADFALSMKETLMNINYQSFNNFMLRIGKWGGSGAFSMA